MGARSTKHESKRRSIFNETMSTHNQLSIVNKTQEVTKYEDKSIIDVPSEVIHKFIMAHLSDTDVYSFGMTGVKRFKKIAENELGKRRE